LGGTTRDVAAVADATLLAVDLTAEQPAAVRQATVTATTAARERHNGPRQAPRSGIGGNQQHRRIKTKSFG
jgi:hypothetical protein